jgi:demethylmenaquinone methyltransferase/2-methoxy-6-polyprenyl-1,4-benzoquinol methylase
LALLAYSSQQLLPGHPGLEARLNATRAGQLPFRSGDAPGHHFMRLSERFSQAGLADIKVKSFMAEFSAPLDPAVRGGLSELMDMRWGAARPELSRADWDMFQNLSRPGSPNCILQEPGYYGFFTYTTFTARKPY